MNERINELIDCIKGLEKRIENLEREHHRPIDNSESGANHKAYRVLTPDEHRKAVMLIHDKNQNDQY